jgi:hypothetical protein
MRTLALLVCGLALAGALASATPAAPPDRETFKQPFEVVYDCGAFELREVGAFVGSDTTHFDREGEPLRTISQVAFDGVITNMATGETFSDTGHQTVVFQSDGSIVINGISFMVRSERTPEAIDVGRVIVDANGDVLFRSARHDLLADGLGDTDAAICAALG